MMKAIALVTDSVIKSPLKDYLTRTCHRAGLSLDLYSVTHDCKSYVERFKAHQNIITWNCRMPHSWLTNKGKNLLFIENSLLMQRSGVFVDAGGYYSNSNLCRDKSWLDVEENKPLVEDFVRRQLRWEPFRGGAKNGPILVCLQNSADCNLRFEFPYGKSFDDKVEATLKFLHEYLPDNGRKVLIRPHPRCVAQWEERFPHYREHYWRNSWEASVGGDFYKLLPQCSALVSVNSTTVSEAVSCGIPVATLGTGVFSGSNITLECAHDPSNLRNLPDFVPDMTKCRRYISAILTRHHLPYKIRDNRENVELSKWLAAAQKGGSSREIHEKARNTGTAVLATPKHLGGHMGVTHIDRGAVEWLKEKFGVRSMVDIGCGPGGMQQVALELGIEWMGIDGDPLIKNEHVITHDYTLRPLKVPRVDLAWSVEFLEHVAEKHIKSFMATFSCARHVCVTHALPGKPGWHHVNCQPPEYWIKVFTEHGFSFDKITTEEIRQKSSMKRDFVRKNGLFFSAKS
jgi:hypothetical protein